MAIQISLPRRNPGDAPIYTTAFVYTEEAIVKFGRNVLEVGWTIHADKRERDSNASPIETFGTRFRFADVTPFTQSTLKGKIDQALKDLCSAEANNPDLNLGSRIDPRLRNAIIAGTIVSD